MNGPMTITPRKRTVTVISTMRTISGSFLAALMRFCGLAETFTIVPRSFDRFLRPGDVSRAWSRGGVEAAAPAFEQVDHRQGREGKQQEHHRDGGRLGVLVLVQPGDDQERRDLGLERQVAGDEDD